jgi:hypothetical protein
VQYLENIDQQSKLKAIIEREKKKDGKYQVVLGFSGGKDSLYGLHLLQTLYEVNVLLVNFNNGFQSHFIASNLENFANKMSADLIVENTQDHEYGHILKEIFCQTGDVCLHCDIAIYSMLLRVARENQIGIVAMGGGSSEGLTQVSNNRAIDVFCYAKTFYENAGIPLDRYCIDEKSFEGLDFIQLGDYFIWNHTEIEEVVRSRLGMELSDFSVNKSGYMHGDCNLCRVQDYSRFKKKGFSRNQPLLASLVRNGQMTRKKAIELLRSDEDAASKEPPSLKIFLELTGLSKKDFIKIFNDPSVQYCPPWYHK